MSISSGLPLIAGVGVGAFIFGWIAAKVFAFLFRRSATAEALNQHHQLRSLDASLRVAQKKADDSVEQLEMLTAEFDDLREKYAEAEDLLYKREVQLCDQKQAMNDETTKVRALRVELVDRAEEAIRAESATRQVETELSVMHAGSEAMSSEVGRLAAEHESLSTRLDMFETGAFTKLQPQSDDADKPENERAEEDFLPDC